MAKDKALVAARDKVLKAARKFEDMASSGGYDLTARIDLSNAALTYGRQVKANRAAAIEKRKTTLELRRNKIAHKLLTSPHGRVALDNDD